MTDREAINGLQNIVEYWTLNPHEQAVAEYAISALKEREERSKGCDWCIGFCPDVTGDPYSNYRYCPMCGRKLRED